MKGKSKRKVKREREKERKRKREREKKFSWVDSLYVRDDRIYYIYINIFDWSRQAQAHNKRKQIIFKTNQSRMLLRIPRR